MPGDWNRRHQFDCCTKPNHTTAWTPCKPFKARYCYNCEEVMLDVGPVLDWVWGVFVAPFWTGRVIVEDHKQRLGERDTDGG